MKLNLEAKTKEQQRIKAYLEENASDILAGKINNGVLIKKDGKILLNRKTMDGFMSFATEEARKQAEKGAIYAMVDDAVVFGWAVHYFEEDSIEGTLFNEDGSEYKTQPKPAAKAPTVKAQPKPQPKPQMSMFDLMGEDLEGKPDEEKPEDDEDAMPSDEEIQEIMAEIAEEEKAKQQKPSTSPMYRKYMEVQGKYPQAVIAMRLGDFYEVFGNNAVTLSDELGLTLTGRDFGLTSRIPMIGFPYHAADNYFTKIVQKHNVAIAETKDDIRLLPEEEYDYDDLTEEEMRKFDGDIEEPKYIDDELGDRFDTSAFDKTVLCKLDAIFGDKLALR